MISKTLIQTATASLLLCVVLMQRLHIGTCDPTQGVIYGEIVSTLIERAADVSKWKATDMRIFHDIKPQSGGSKERAVGGINSLQVNAMSLLVFRLKNNYAMLSNHDLVKHFENGHTCSSQEVKQQMLHYKAPSICADILPFKIAQMIWPEASVFIDVGVNRGFISSLALSLWGGGGYNTNPYSLFEAFKKHGYFVHNKNPGGICSGGYNLGYPLYCPSQYREVDGKCNITNKFHVYSIDASPYIVNNLNEAITQHFASPAVSRLWKIYNFAVSDKIGAVELSKHNKSLSQDFERRGIQRKKAEFSSGTEVVAMTTLDEFSKNFILEDNIDVIKINAEGYDSAILRGAQEIISKRKVGILCWKSNKISDLKQNIKMLSQIRFDCYSPRFTGFVKLTGGCVNKLRRGGNVFCISRDNAPGVYLAFEALSRYHLSISTGAEPDI